MDANEYAAAEVMVLGRAQDVVRGVIKGVLFDDGPAQWLRTVINEDTE
jgi:hypothetical protein